MSGELQTAVSMVERRSWEEFRESGLLWWVNRTLHLFALQSWVLRRLTLCDGETQKFVGSNVANDILKSHCFSVDLAEYGASRNDEPHPRLPKFLNSVCETK